MYRGMGGATLSLVSILTIIISEGEVKPKFLMERRALVCKYVILIIEYHI
jgi:hypothetical protein